MNSSTSPVVNFGHLQEVDRTVGDRCGTPLVAAAGHAIRVLGTIIVSATAFFAYSTGAKASTPRLPLPKGPVQAPVLGETTKGDGLNLRLIVKFADISRARALPNGRIEFLGHGDSAAVDRVIQDFGMSCHQLIQLPQVVLFSLEQRASALSGIEQPDLSGMMVVALAEPSPSILKTAGELLQALDEVEFAYIQVLLIPPPGDIPPTTPDLVPMQHYLGPDPGIDADYASAHGASGAGIRLSDCEYGWRASHEDLVDQDLHPEPGQTPHPGVTANGWDEHGTSAVGISAAPGNGYGIDGTVEDAVIYTYPEWTVEAGYRRVTAITNAIAASEVGDVVLLEMQTTGDGGDYGPAELDPAVWTVVKAGSDAGVVIVAAAGNGSQDLDSPAYAPYMARGDSGAIIVGAGSPDAAHNRLGFSTYGSRVNVQGWGGAVFTLGYGHFATYGGDPNQRYTDYFSGTSSASAMVAAACVMVQSFSLAETGQALLPLVLRDLLFATGVPQGAGGHIGPLPDLRAALQAIEPVFVDGFESGDSSAWSSTVPE